MSSTVFDDYRNFDFFGNGGRVTVFDQSRQAENRVNSSPAACFNYKTVVQITIPSGNPARIGLFRFVWYTTNCNLCVIRAQLLDVSYCYFSLNWGCIMVLRTCSVFFTTLLMIGFVATAKGDTFNFVFQGKAGFGLLTGNENPAATGNGSGGVIAGITYDTDTNIMAIDIGWGSGNGFNDLTGDVTAIHIHGPADFNTNAGVIVNLGNLGGLNGDSVNGGYSNASVAIPEAQEQNLLDGLLYVNAHTAANPGGEIRGNFVQAIPEPSSAAVLAIVVGAGLLRRRNRR